MYGFLAVVNESVLFLWRKRQENIKEGNAIKHISLKTLKRILWLLFLYKIVVFPSCFDTRRNLIYMLYLEWYDVKLIENLWNNLEKREK